MRLHVATAVRRSMLGPVVYAAGTLISLVSAQVAFALYAVVAVFHGLSGRRLRVASEASGPVSAAPRGSGLTSASDAPRAHAQRQ